MTMKTNTKIITKTTNPVTDNAMMGLLGRTILLCAIPKAIDTVYDLFFNPEERKPKVSMPKTLRKKPLLGIPAKTTTRKKHDTHVITRQHFDYVIEYYEKVQEENKSKKRRNRVTVDEITKHLNSMFNYDKSSTSYSLLYKGHIKREDLIGTTDDIFTKKTSKVTSFKDIKALIK